MRFRDLVIIYNGEIYNYLELRQELEIWGTVRDRTDTEVILHAYDAWGDQCLHRFTGMWAFAILDEAKGEVFSPGPLRHQAPLITGRRERFLFASEIKAILAAAFRPGE